MVCLDPGGLLRDGTEGSVSCRWMGQRSDNMLRLKGGQDNCNYAQLSSVSAETRQQPVDQADTEANSHECL